MARAIVLAILLGSASALNQHSAGASVLDTEEDVSANPIRKIVGLLQGLAKKVEEEGVKAAKLHDDNLCYCKKATAEITASISTQRSKKAELNSGLEEARPKLKTLKDELKSQQEDQAAAKGAIDAAQKQRDNALAAYTSETSETKSVLGSLGSAITALGKGQTGFIQEKGMQARLQSAVETTLNLSEYQRNQIMIFLAGSRSDEAAPGSSEIVGMLKTMKQSSEAGLAEADAEEEEQATNHVQLVAAKKEQFNLLNEPIREKIERIAALAISMATSKKDLSVVKDGLSADEAFATDLSKTCADSKTNFDKSSQARNEEKTAIQATIKILNDDDALETFKKTLPGASLLQVDLSARIIRSKALEIVRASRSSAKRSAGSGADMDLLELALKGGKTDFTKINKMIENMVKLLDQEQATDDTTIANCKKQAAASKDQIRAFTQKIKYGSAQQDDKQEELTGVAEGLQTTTRDIQELDASVTEAGNQRKAEHSAYVQLTMTDNGAVGLLRKAQARMSAFYKNAGVSLIQISSHLRLGKEQQYAKQDEAGNKIISMLARLIDGLTNEVTAAEAEENNSQSEYEKMVADAADRRAANMKELVEQGSVEADTKGALLDMKQSLEAQKAQKADSETYASSIRAQCGWLETNFEERKTARAAERQSLVDTRATLAGAKYDSDFSLVQQGQKALRGA